MDLENRLELLESRAALIAAQNSYAQAFDNRDPKLFRAAFHEDAVLDLGELWGTHKGIEAILGAANQFWAGARSMHHWMVNPLFEIDVAAGEGSGSVALDCVSTFVDTGTFHIGGRYEDRFRRIRGDWKISERRFEVQFRTPVPDWAPELGTEVAVLHR